MRRENRLLDIGGEEDGTGAHRDKGFVEDNEVLRDVDCNYSVPFIGGGRIQSKKSIST